MATNIPGVALADVPTTAQRLYVRYLLAILVDLTVLNLFDEYWERVSVDSFTISMFAAVLLQVLLQATLLLERRVARLFEGRASAGARILRYLSAWLILFLSKFVILEALSFVFSDEVRFSGALHGVVAFIVVIVAMLATEEFFLRIYRYLADRPDGRN